MSNLNKADRQKALEWWSTIEYKNLLASSRLKDFGKRHHTSLTGREIEQIWRTVNN